MGASTQAQPADGSPLQLFGDAETMACSALVLGRPLGSPTGTLCRAPGLAAWHGALRELRRGYRYTRKRAGRPGLPGAGACLPAGAAHDLACRPALQAIRHRGDRGTQPAAPPGVGCALPLHMLWRLADEVIAAGSHGRECHNPEAERARW